MNIIFSIQGGLGKSVVGTAVAKAIRKNYPICNLIVLTGYPEVFSNLPYVNMAFNFGEEHYFYSKYVENQEVKIFATDPYNITEHLLGQEHLIQTWCKMFGLEYSGELPEIAINNRERQFYNNKYPTEKPIMVLQSHGGAPQQEIKYSWSRDMPFCVIDAIVNEFQKDYHIFHIRRDDQFQIANTFALTDSFKGVASVIERSAKRIFIDSFAQHTAAALSMKSTVLWICNKPNVFGYVGHDNISANSETIKPDLRYSMFSKYSIVGALSEFPYNEEREIFDTDRIIESIYNQK